MLSKIDWPECDQLDLAPPDTAAYQGGTGVTLHELGYVGAFDATHTWKLDLADTFCGDDRTCFGYITVDLTSVIRTWYMVFGLVIRRSFCSVKMAPSVNIKTAANDFLSFVNASPTPFHAVNSVKQKLSKAGFEEIKERDSWSSTCVPGGKYYLTRNGSTVIAFAIGRKWRPGNPVAMLGAHTDSPCLKIKPVSKKQGEGFLQVGVETYGGGLWHTWFDRDLGIAGRVMVRESGGKIIQKLVHIDKPSECCCATRCGVS